MNTLAIFTFASGLRGCGFALVLSLTFGYQSMTSNGVIPDTPRGGIEPEFLVRFPVTLRLGRVHILTRIGCYSGLGRNGGLGPMISRTTLEADRTLAKQMDEIRLGQLERASERSTGGSGQSRDGA